MNRTVKIRNGLVEGLPAADPRITSFKGIPYAAPPVGELRWKAPQKAKDWNGVLKAWSFAPWPVQKKPGMDPDKVYTREWQVDSEVEMSEDSLYLNVWTPSKTFDEKLPVYIWFYGGGFQEGSTAEMEFDGERIARRGIVVVTVGYRLNAFGFLAHPLISAESPDAPTNFGFLDQRQSMIWVKENIAAFGGDPDNVTIGGHSAGGGSVLAQYASPTTKGLFDRIVIDSGVRQLVYRPVRPPYTLKEAEKLGISLFEALGVKTLAEARKLDPFVIRDKVQELKMFIGPVEDGVFTIGNHHEMLMNNQCDIKPMMVIHTSTEFPGVPPVDSLAGLAEYARAEFGEDAEEFLRIVKSEGGSLLESKYKATVNELEFTCRLFGEMKTATGEKTPMYYCVFGPDYPGWDDPGCFHGADLWFFFETLAKCWRPFKGHHYDLARQMCNYLANFIKCGDPNGPDADGRPMPQWDPYTAEDPCRMYFGRKIFADREKPSELMQFLLRHEMKKRGY